MNSSVGGYVPPQRGDEGGADNGQSYYYYEMPDGSIGYITASEYNQMYSPAERQEAEEAGPQPAGYVEPTYGQGTAYTPAQEQYITASQLDTNNRNYSSVSNNLNNSNMNYRYVAQDAYSSNAAATNPPPATSSQQLQQQPAYLPQVVYAESPEVQQPGIDAMTAASPPELPHEAAGSGWYKPPPSFAEMRKWNGSQKWYNSQAGSCWKEPCYCLGACVAPWCVVAAHRRRLLLKDDKQYRCCAGVCGRVDDCECCGDTSRCSLFWEVLCCLPCACHANRYMLMQRYNLKKSCWDGTVLGFGCFCAPCHWCSECTCWFPESMCDWLYVIVYPFMLTQNHRELDAHEKAVS